MIYSVLSLIFKYDSTEAEEEDLRSHFANCGEIESVRIVRDKKLASGKGFGYINFVVGFRFAVLFLLIWSSSTLT